MQTPSEVEPVLDALALAQADVEQDAGPVGGEAPGHEHALLRPLGPGRQVDRVHEQREQADLAEALRPEGPVAVAQLAADGAHGGPADRAEPGLPGQALDVAVGQAPDVRADDERLERAGPDDRSGVGDDRADEAGQAVRGPGAWPR